MSAHDFDFADLRASYCPGGHYQQAAYYREQIAYSGSDQVLVYWRHQGFPRHEAAAVVWGQLLCSEYKLLDLGHS